MHTCNKKENKNRQFLKTTDPNLSIKTKKIVSPIYWLVKAYRLVDYNIVYKLVMYLDLRK